MRIIIITIIIITAIIITIIIVLLLLGLLWVLLHFTQNTTQRTQEISWNSFYTGIKV